jgi:hypothetical protein
LAVIDQLELLGYSIELWVSLPMSADIKRDIVAHCVNVKLKSTNERANLACIAFALCNTAFFRRLWFRHLEADKEHSKLSADLYGFTMELPEKERAKYDVYFTALEYGQYSSPEEARADILNQIITQTTKSV